MRKILSLAMIGTMVAVFAGVAQGVNQETSSTLTATVATPSGTRLLTSLGTLGAMTYDSTSRTYSATLSAEVTEALADGVDNWYVTAISSDFSGTAGTIGASNLSLGTVAASVTGAGALVGTPNSTGSGGTLEQARTMFTVTGETAGAFPGYTGVYTGSGDLTLTVPAGTAQGVYTATVTVTLIN